jgi:hypothetical protein
LDDLELSLSLDSDDLPCHHALVPLCQCGVPARQGVVPLKLGYNYFCGNIVGENDAWVSSHSEICLCRQHTRCCDWEEFDVR